MNKLHELNKELIIENEDLKHLVNISGQEKEYLNKQIYKLNKKLNEEKEENEGLRELLTEITKENIAYKKVVNKWRLENGSK